MLHPPCHLILVEVICLSCQAVGSADPENSRGSEKCIVVEGVQPFRDISEQKIHSEVRATEDQAAQAHIAPIADIIQIDPFPPAFLPGYVVERIAGPGRNTDDIRKIDALVEQVFVDAAGIYTPHPAPFQDKTGFLFQDDHPFLFLICVLLDIIHQFRSLKIQPVFDGIMLNIILRRR